MIVAVLGASGRTGRLVVDASILAGHRVRVLVRDPKRGPAPPPSIDVILGDPTAPDAVARVLDGADAAISALGPRPGSDVVNLCSTATRHVITATRHVTTVASERAAFRYVVVSAAGVQNFVDDSPLLFRIPSIIVRTLLRASYRDKDDEAAALIASHLDWVALRPPALTDGPAKGSVQSHRSRSGGGRIPRAGLAEFAVRMLVDPTYIRQAPFVWA